MTEMFLEKSPCRITARISATAKDAITRICEKREINESQFLKIAIQSQIKADEPGTVSTPKTSNE